MSTLLVAFEGRGIVQYPPDLDRDNPGADYGQVLARLGRHVDQLARDLEVRPLSDFHYADPEMLEGILQNLQGERRANVERILTTQREWHPVSEGRHTVATLLAFLEALTPEAARSEHSQLVLGGALAPLIADLRALEHVLNTSDSRFHLESL